MNANDHVTLYRAIQRTRAEIALWEAARIVGWRDRVRCLKRDLAVLELAI